jgi:O-antigen/teichoic acid export membrane protein
MFLGIPLAIGGSFLAKPIILFLYKDKFIQSSGVFSLLIFSIMIVFFGATFGTILLNSDKKGSRFYAVVAAGGVVLNVIMNLILIPKWTYYGAAAATLATDFFTSFLAFFYVVHLVGPLRIGSSLIKACLSSLIMVVGLYFLEPFNLRLPVLIVIGMVIYTLCAILFKFFQSRDMEVLKMVLLSPQSSSKEITE